MIMTFEERVETFLIVNADALFGALPKQIKSLCQEYFGKDWKKAYNLIRTLA